MNEKYSPTIQQYNKKIFKLKIKIRNMKDKVTEYSFNPCAAGTIYIIRFHVNVTPSKMALKSTK